MSTAAASAAPKSAPPKAAAPTPAAATKHTCATKLEVGRAAATQTIVCRYRNSDPTVYVGVKALSNYKLADHDNTISFYGHGVVVRLHQAGKVIHIRAVSVSGEHCVRVVLAPGPKRSSGFGKGHGRPPTGHPRGRSAARAT